MTNFIADYGVPEVNSKMVMNSTHERSKELPPFSMKPSIVPG